MGATPPPPPQPDPDRLHRRVAKRIVEPVQAFAEVEAAGGIVLLAATVVAVVWATSRWSAGYERLFHTEAGPHVLGLHLSVQHWIDDGLMAVFFFVVGLEIKREWVAGELRDRRAAATPAIAALAGMLVPAAVYAAVVAGGVGRHGWGIPMATDIAFALAALTVLGDRIPRSLKVFLLTLAIVDDIGAIVVIAIFYAGDLRWGWVAGAAALVGLLALLRRTGLRHPLPYAVAGVALWLCTYRSGIHATIAGVLLALLLPNQPAESNGHEEAGAAWLERKLHPWSSFVVVPLFALANAGIDLRGHGFAAPTAISMGIVAGLVVGKAVGITGGTWLAVRTGLGRAPEGARGVHLLGVGILGGIGFTVSLFVAGLAFPSGPHLQEAKAGILVASALAAALGIAVLALAGRRGDDEPRHRAAGTG